VRFNGSPFNTLNSQVYGNNYLVFKFIHNFKAFSTSSFNLSSNFVFSGVLSLDILEKFSISKVSKKLE